MGGEGVIRPGRPERARRHRTRLTSQATRGQEARPARTDRQLSLRSDTKDPPEINMLVSLLRTPAHSPLHI